MQTAFGTFRNDGNDGNDGNAGGLGVSTYAGRAPSTLLAQALWTTNGELTRGFEGGGQPNTSINDPIKPEQAFGRWSRDIRGHLYTFELLSGLELNTSAQKSATLRFRGTKLKDFKLQAPRYE